jgi:acetyl-CoA C-acetyltransferase
MIVSAVRTTIGTAVKGTLAGASALDLAQVTLEEAVRRSGPDKDAFDDVVLAESGWGGGDIARPVRRCPATGPRIEENS